MWFTEQPIGWLTEEVIVGFTKQPMETLIRKPIMCLPWSGDFMAARGNDCVNINL